MERTIFLVRHAEAAGADGQKRYVGQMDPDLSPLGVRQAEELGAAFRHRPVRAVFSSDLRRAMRTALPIAGSHGCRPEPVRDLREIGLGEWEGRTFDEVRAQYPEEFERRGQDLAGYRPPGGESFADLQQRALRAFTDIAEKTGGDLVIVAHAGVNRVILCHLMRRPLQELFSIPQDAARVSIVWEDGGGYRVLAVNAGPDSLMSPADRGLP